jgi:hypothetical protein
MIQVQDRIELIKARTNGITSSGSKQVVQVSLQHCISNTYNKIGSLLLDDQSEPGKMI